MELLKLIGPINPAFAFASAAMGIIAVTSLAVGKAPYQDFFKRNYIVRRKWEPTRFWVSVTFCFAACAVFALMARYALPKP